MQPSKNAAWFHLLQIAARTIASVNADQAIVDRWTLGGGTALMLQIDHRESKDIDLFITDPQVLPYFDPERGQVDYGSTFLGASGDGARFLKLAFEAGEIDFIVSRPLTKNPDRAVSIDGIQLFLETLPEIIAKKIVWRGAGLTPRDIFDIAASARTDRSELIQALLTSGAKLP